jgi:hypothetical protein
LKGTKENDSIAVLCFVSIGTNQGGDFSGRSPDQIIFTQHAIPGTSYLMAGAVRKSAVIKKRIKSKKEAA